MLCIVQPFSTLQCSDFDGLTSGVLCALRVSCCVVKCTYVQVACSFIVFACSCCRIVSVVNHAMMLMMLPLSLVHL